MSEVGIPPPMPIILNVDAVQNACCKIAKVTNKNKKAIGILVITSFLLVKNKYENNRLTGRIHM